MAGDLLTVMRGAAVTFVGAFIAGALNDKLELMATRAAVAQQRAAHEEARGRRARLIGPQRLDEVEGDAITTFALAGPALFGR